MRIILAGVGPLQKKDALEVSVTSFKQLKRAEKDAVQEQAEHFGQFLDMPIRLSLR